MCSPVDAHFQAVEAPTGSPTVCVSSLRLMRNAPLPKQNNLNSSGEICLAYHDISWATGLNTVLLNHRCLVCNCNWERLHPATVRICHSFSAQTMNGQKCPYCQHKVPDRRQHPEQCPVLYQLPKPGHSPLPRETQSLHRFFGTEARSVQATAEDTESGRVFPGAS